MAVRSSSTNGCPMPPTPTGSPVPRANTASTSAHGSADEVGVGTLSSPLRITKAAGRTRPIWRRHMVSIVAMYPRTRRTMRRRLRSAGFGGVFRAVQHAHGHAVGQESDFAARVGVALIGPQRVEFGGVDLLDAGAAVVADR